jgi:hypothetical protein
MMAVSEASNIVGPCPSDEEIAAFVDGMLSSEERRRLIAHLAECKDCYEVLAGVLSFQKETAETAEVGDVGRIVPFPRERTEERKPLEPTRRLRPGRLRWLPAAAAAVLALGIGYTGYHARIVPPRMTVADLTAPLVSRPEAAQQLYELSVSRDLAAGPRTQDLLDRERPSFMAGVLLVDLRLVPRADRAQAASEILQQIGEEIASVAQEDLVERYRQDAEKAKNTAFVRQVETELPRREDELAKALDPAGFAFGKWSEACRLAAVSETPEIFTGRDSRRFLSLTMERKEKALAKRSPAIAGNRLNRRAERDAEILRLLRQIDAAWKLGAPPRDYPELAKDFNELIGLYDR